MSNGFAALTQTKVPLTSDDREELRKAFATAAVVGGVIAALAAVGSVAAFAHASSSEGVEAGFSVLVALGLLAVLAGCAWILRVASADRRATEKIVYAGTITDKRVERVDDSARNPAQPQSDHVRYVLGLDGVDFTVNALHHAAVEPGQRAELHCVRAGSPFRVIRA